MAGEVGKKEEEVRVKIIGKSHAKPEKRLGRKECQLVTFDLPYLAFYYNQKLLFYKGDDDDFDFEGMVKKLKNGLSAVLEEFYQLAGRIGKDEDGVLRVEYDDEMPGVEIFEAATVDDEIAIADLTAQQDTSTLKEFIPYNDVLNLEGMHKPLLAIQLTKLKDGLAMGCAFNHAVLDGSSTWHFISSWAEICRGSQITAQPFLDRTKARNTRVKLDLSLPPDVHPYSSDGSHDVKRAPQLREKVFKFSEAQIDKIKSMVNEILPSEGLKPFSTFQSLSVHIWRHISHARNLKPADFTVFAVFADCRKRVEPPLPDYFGNLIQAVFTVTAAGLLTGNPPDYGASMIQKAIEMHNSKAIDEKCKEWEREPKIFQYKDAGPNCVVVGSSPRFKVYEVDFGWGKPECVRSGSNNRFDGVVYLYQGKNGGRSIDVEISLEAGAMERLEKDREFLLEL